jgi:hypothetical protein
MKTLGWNMLNNPILLMDDFESFKSWQIASAEKLGGVSKIKVAVPANLFAEIPEHIPWMN